MAPTFLFAILMVYFPTLVAFIETPGKPGPVLLIFLTTCVLMFLIIFVLQKMKLISRITLENQRERYIPQVILSLIYLLITGYLAYRYGLRDGFTLSMIASSLTAVGITLINRFWKISTHASGVAGVFGIVSVLFLHHQVNGFFPVYLTICFLTLAVCLARLYLKVHTPMQVVCGFLLGGVSGVLLFFYK